VASLVHWPFSWIIYWSSINKDPYHSKVCMHNTLVGMSSCKLCQVPTSILFLFIQRDVFHNIRCSWDFLRPWDRSDSDLDPPESWYTFHRNRRPFNYPLQEGKQAKLRWISGEFKKGLGMGQDWSLQVKQMVEMCRQPLFLWGWIFPPSVTARP